MKQDGKPCPNCSEKKMVVAPTGARVTAAGTYDLLVSWGVSEDAASAVVDSGVRATDAHDAKSVLAAALSASDERARTIEEAYVELEKEFTKLEEQYNVLQEAFEGHFTTVPGSAKEEDEVDEDVS